MRKFFAKPIFLIIGIVLSVYITASAVLCLLSKQVPVFDFISTAMCVAFFVFYFKAHSKREIVSFRAPTVLMNVVSIIGIVFSSLITAFFGLFPALIMLNNNSSAVVYHGYETLFASIAEELRTAFLIIFPVIAVIGLLLLFYFIGMNKMCRSFKKSLSNIYLQRKGSVMFGVMSVIFAVLSADAMIACLTAFRHSLNIFAIIECTNTFLIFICMAVLGFMYNSYIKKLVNSIETGRPVQETTNNTEGVTENNPTLNMWAEPENYNQPHRQATVTRPVEFTPQAVFGDSKSDEVITIPTEYQPPKNDMHNPYLKNTADATKRCANCGKENPNINIFCGNCGNRL